MTTVTIHSERTQVEIDNENRVVEIVTRGERRVEIAKVGLRGPIGPQGPPGNGDGGQGPPGPPGPAGKHGQIRFTGMGPPPAVIVGSEPGDTYMDIASGDVYKLI